MLKKYIEQNILSDNILSFKNIKNDKLICNEFEPLEILYFNIFLYMSSLQKTVVERDKILNSIKGLTTELQAANICFLLKEYEKGKEFLDKYKKRLDVELLLCGRNSKINFFKNQEKSSLILIIKPFDKENIKGAVYETKDYIFPGIEACKLDLNLMSIVLTELEYLIETDRDNVFYKDNINAYLDRLLQPESINNEYYKRLIYYYRSFVDGNFSEHYYDLIFNTTVNEDQFTFDIPVKYFYKHKKRIGELLINNFRYKTALKIFTELHDYDNMIKCYFGMDQEEKAIEKIKFECKCLENQMPNTSKNKDNATEDIISKIRLYDYYILLGKVTKEINYFDKAYDLMKNYQALENKALIYNKQENFKEALNIYETILKEIRTSKVLFQYGCTMISNNEYEKAQYIFEELLLFDDKNSNVYRNLSICCIENKDYDKGIDCLESAIKYSFEPNLRNLFLFLCVKYDRKDKARKLIEDLKAQGQKLPQYYQEIKNIL